jgi:hypothetical protein
MQALLLQSSIRCYISAFVWGVRSARGGDSTEKAAALRALNILQSRLDVTQEP